MRWKLALAAAVGGILVAACGVPREAADLAASAAAATTIPAADADVRAALAAQPAAWERLDQTLAQQQFGGITGVDDQFRALVTRTAALARRDAELIAQGRDDPAEDREALAQFSALWQQASRYLKN